MARHRKATLPKEYLDIPADCPDLLRVMRLVSIGQAPDTDIAKTYVTVFKNNPVKFLERMEKLEIAYFESKREAAKMKPPEDEGIERALLVAEQWLRDNGVDTE